MVAGLVVVLAEKKDIAVVDETVVLRVLKMAGAKGDSYFEHSDITKVVLKVVL